MKSVTQENFEQEVLSVDGPVLVDVYADWCGPCKKMTPTVEKLSQDYNVCKMNMDDGMDLCKQYNISAIPAFLFFKNGELVETKVGIQKGSDLRTTLDKLS